MQCLLRLPDEAQSRLLSIALYLCPMLFLWVLLPFVVAILLARFMELKGHVKQVKRVAT